MRTIALRLAAILTISCAGIGVSPGPASSFQESGQQPHLVAGPTLGFLRLFGGTKAETSGRVAVGGSGNIFLTGSTTSPNWPTPTKASCACSRAFLIKLSADATRIYYAVVLGGSRPTYVANVAVDPAGNAYLTGLTASPDFPTVRPLQAHCRAPNPKSCSTGFVTKIDPKGNIAYSTFLGGKGPDYPSAIVVDAAGEAYVAGETKSPNFPTVHAVQPHLRGPSDGFVAKIDAAGKHSLYSTYLGGSKDDSINGLAVDRLGQAYLTGTTDSKDFRTSPRAVQSNFVGGNCNFFACGDAFVVKLGTVGRFLAGTFIGTPADEAGNGVAVDTRGNVYAAGYTGSARIPATRAAPPTGKALCGSEGDVLACESAFVVELTPRLDRLIYSRDLAGNGLDTVDGIAVDTHGAAVIGGYTESDNFPVVNPIQPATGGGDCSEAKGNVVPCDGFVAVIAPGGGAITFSTYLGGNKEDLVAAVATDGRGNTLVAGTTWSPNFPSGGATTLSLPKVFLARITGIP
jgi:Beta-propeller repeat